MIKHRSLLNIILVIVASCLLLSCSSSDKKTKTAADAKSSSKPWQQLSYKVDAPISTPKYDEAALKSVDSSSSAVENALDKAFDGDVTGAIDALKKATEKYPKSFLAFYDLGILYERQANAELAKAAYRDALKAEPNFTPALMQLVRMDIRKGQAAYGLNTANQFIIQNPSVFGYNYAKLEALVADKQYDNAITLARSLLKQDEANPVLRYYIALTEFERGRYRLAEFMIGESLEIDPDDYEAIFLRARIHQALSEEDVSLIPGIATDLDRVIELNPDHFEAVWMRGVIYYEAANYNEAQEYFRHMIELQPYAVGGYINLANTYKTLDRGPEAEQLLQKAKSLEPENGLVDFALGTLYLNTELIKLPMKDMERLKVARVQFENAAKHWTSKDDIALANGYIRTTDDAIETLQAMIDAESLFNSPAPAPEENQGDQGNDNLRVD